MPSRTTLLAAPDTQKLLDEIIRVIRDLFHFPHCAILLADELSNELCVVASRGYRRQVLRNFRIAMGREGVTGWVAKHRKPLYVPDVRKDPRYIAGIARGRSELAVPLLIGRQLIGVLDVESEKIGAFSNSDVRILSHFANQAAVAIYNARLYELERKKTAQLRLINEVSRRMAATLDLHELLPLAVQAIRRNFDYYHVMILLKEEPDEIVMRAQAGAPQSRMPEGYRRRIGEGIIGTVAQTGKTIVANDVSRDPRYARVRQHTRAELCVPIKQGRELLGVINVESDRLGSFDRTDRDILELIAGQFAQVIRNAKVYQECKEAKDYLQTLIESSSDAITTADNSGRLIFWSKGAEAIFGYKPDEVLGRPAADFYVKGREEALRIMELLRRKGKIKNVEVEYWGKNRKRIYASLSAALLRDNAGGVTGSLGIIRDITEYKVLMQQLIQAERLATIGRLSTQIGHEIMNPLSSIKMNIRILSKRNGLSPNDQRRLAIASFEIEHLEKILQEIFDYSKALQLRLERADINRILGKALLMVEDRLQEKRIRVSRRFAKDLPPLRADEGRLLQVFSNLYLNAIQAMGAKGRLQVSSSLKKGPDGPSVVVSVTDNGRGIPASHRDVIFDPFYTTRSDGTGLGLTVVKKIVEQHGGQIEVESQPGRYTRFRVSLPLSAAIGS
ncbi:MAG: GAF domain-containing protein [Acidobacteriota bacterium]